MEMPRRPRSRRQRIKNEKRRALKEIQNSDDYQRNNIPTYIASGPNYTRIIRYQLDAVTASTISGAQLLDSIFMATGTTSGARIFSAIRVRRIRMWCAGNLSTVDNVATIGVQISLEWMGSQWARDQKYQDEALGTKIAYIDTKPPKNSMASWWIVAGSATDTTGAVGNMFRLGGPDGTIVDVTIEYTMIDDESAIPVVRSVSAATAGKLYYSPLDGPGGAWVPRGVNTI